MAHTKLGRVEMTRKLILVGVVVIVVAAIVWHMCAVRAYEAKIQAEWSGLDGALTILDSTIATRSKDFTNTRQSIDDLKSRVDRFKVAMVATNPPYEYVRFHNNLVAYLDKMSITLASMSDNCVTWLATKSAELERESTAARDLCKDCANSWRGRRPLGYKSDLFAQVTANFNAMHRSRKQASVPSPVSVTYVVAERGIPAYFQAPSSSVASDYYSQMRSLVARYKGMRGDLERARVSERTRYTGCAISDYDRAILVNARDNRQVIFNQMNSLSVPSGCERIHDIAIGAVANGLDAVNSLLAGNWDEFHRRSNNGMAAQAYRAFGIGG